jgi:hypothetical protein
MVRMTVAKQHLVLDFARPSQGDPLDFSKQVLAACLTAKVELFGSDWPRV